MKFFEQEAPSVLIKAENMAEAINVYSKEISEDILEYPEEFELKEVSSDYAWGMFSKATDENGNVIPINEIRKVFDCTDNELLCCSKTNF